MIQKVKIGRKLGFIDPLIVKTHRKKAVEYRI